MKKQSLILHFLLFFAVFLFCILPPVITEPQQDNNYFPVYSFSIILLSVLWSSICIFAIYNQKHGSPSFSTTGIKHFLNFANIKFKIKLKKCISCYKNGLVTLALIFISGFIADFFSGRKNIAVPQKSLFEWALFFIITVILACTEEILYRYYLPKTLNYFIEQASGTFHAEHKTLTKISKGICEIFVILLFALGHRYSGLPAVFHAFFAGILLRWNIKKTDTLVSVCLIHSFYNCLVFAIYIFSNLH